MRIDDYRTGTSFEITCTRHSDSESGETFYSDFGIFPNMAFMWGRKKEDVMTVRATVIEEDVKIISLLKDKTYKKGIDYFGRVEFGNEDGSLTIDMIYPGINQYYVCFPYGPDFGLLWDNDVFDRAGKLIHRKGERRAMNVRLKIEEIKNQQNGQI